jgi:hypothetical protein
LIIAAFREASRLEKASADQPDSSFPELAARAESRRAPSLGPVRVKTVRLILTGLPDWKTGHSPCLLAGWKTIILFVAI